MYFKFDDEVHDYQNFVKRNINVLGNFILLSEQLYIKNIQNNKKSFIDMLALDLNTKRLVILELKNTTAQDGIIGQSIRYYDFISNSSDVLKELLFKKQDEINFDIDQINYNPKVLLIVPDFNEQVLRSLLYVHNIEIDVIKFNAIQKSNYFEIVKEVYEPQECYEELDYEINGQAAKEWNYDEYLNCGHETTKILLLKHFINFIKNLCLEKNKKFNIYFYENKITIMVDKKVWGHIAMKRKLFDNSLELSINLSKGQIVDYCSLRYNGHIQKFKLLDRSLKIQFNIIPTTLLDNLL